MITSSAPIHQGHKFRERDPKTLVDEIERAQRELGVSHFYLWGDTVTLNAKTFGRFCDELGLPDAEIPLAVEPPFLRIERKQIR